MNQKWTKIVRIVILVILALAVAMSLMLPLGAAFSAPTDKEPPAATADSAGEPASEATGESTGGPPAGSSPQATTTTTTAISALNSAGSVIDGQQVVFTGEAVGDIINEVRGRDWVAFFDRGESISVMLKPEQVALISNLGRYDTRGTTLQITGTYHLACNEHDGLSDVHAAQAVVVDAGQPIQHQVDWQFAVLGVVLVVLGGALILIHRYLSKRAR